MKVTCDIEDRENIEVNENGIHYKGPNGFASWKEYGANGLLIHSKNSRGYEV